MPPVTHLVAFALTALVVIAVPGPSVLFTISRALTLGRGGALLTVMGNASGQSVQVAAVAGGLGTVVERSVAVYTVLKLLGAAYLVYLGVRAVRHRHDLREALSAPRAGTMGRRRIVMDGFVVGLTNPKSIVFLVAALPQFVDPNTATPTLQLLVLGALFPLIAWASDSLWAVAAGTARTWLERSRRGTSALGGAAGVTMIGIGASLAVSGRQI